MDYIHQANQKGGVMLQKEFLSNGVRAMEKLMLGLRTQEGVSKDEVEQYAQAYHLSYIGKFNRFLKEGFLSLKDGQYRVTSKGYFVLNGLLEVLVA